MTQHDAGRLELSSKSDDSETGLRTQVARSDDDLSEPISSRDNRQGSAAREAGVVEGAFRWCLPMMLEG